MSVDDLLDENSFSQEKLFDKDKYQTLTISLSTDKTYSEDSLDAMINLLNPNIDREYKDECLKILKKNNEKKLLINGIIEAEDNLDKAVLLAACWESGLDFKDEFLFFIETACHPDYMIALESSTVALSMEEYYNEDKIIKAIHILESDTKGNSQIKEDLKSNLLTRIKN